MLPVLPGHGAQLLPGPRRLEPDPALVVGGHGALGAVAARLVGLVGLLQRPGAVAGRHLERGRGRPGLKGKEDVLLSHVISNYEQMRNCPISYGNFKRGNCNSAIFIRTLSIIYHVYKQKNYKLSSH